MGYRYHDRPCTAYSKASRTRATLTVRNALRVESAGLSDVTWKGSSYFNLLVKRHPRPRPPMVSPNSDKPEWTRSLAADRSARRTHLAELARLMQERPPSSVEGRQPASPTRREFVCVEGPDPTAIATPFLWSVGVRRCAGIFQKSRRRAAPYAGSGEKWPEISAFR